MSYAELEFKWSVYVIDALNQLHVDFLTVSIEANDSFISWL